MKLNPYAYSERGTVIYIGETEPLSLQEERTVIYTGKGVVLPIQGRLNRYLYRGDEVLSKQENTKSKS